MAVPESTASFKLKIQQSSSSIIKSEENYYEEVNKDGGAPHGMIQIDENEYSA